MLINLSFLAIILVVSLFSEQQVRNSAIRCLEKGKNILTIRLPWYLIFGYIAFLAAMRTNANDTSAYIFSFKRLEGTWEAFWNQVSLAGEGKDWAFDAVSILFKMFISQDYHIWFAMYAVVESAAFVYILRRHSVSLLDSCFFFFCSTLYYNYFSMMRQWFAITMLFAASRFIEEEKFRKYLLVCVAVAQFHNSAYMMIPIYFLVQGKAWSKKQMWFIGGFALAMLFLNPILDSMEDTLSGTTYGYVVSTMNTNSGSSLIRAFIAAVPVVLSYLHRDEIDGRMMNICVNMSLLNLLLNVLAAFTSGLYIVRFATYMSVFNMLLFPHLLNICVKGENKKVIKAAFYVVYLAFYFYQMNRQGAFYYGSDILGTFS